MSFNILCGTIKKTRCSSRILLYSSASTTCVPEEIGANAGRNRFSQVPLTVSCCNEIHKISVGQRPVSASFCNNRFIHTSVCKHFCSKEEEKNYSNEGKDDILRKNELAYNANKNLKDDRSNSSLMRQRYNNRRHHQNLVWIGLNEGDRFNKYKTLATLNEKNIEMKEINKSALHTPKKDTDTKLKMKENSNYVSKGQDSCAKNVLTLDIFSDSDNNVRRNRFLQVAPPASCCNEIHKISVGQQPVSASFCNNRFIHTSVCKYFSTKEEEKNYSNEGKDDILRKNELASNANKNLKDDRSYSSLMRQRCNNRRNHQNLVWSGLNEGARFNKYKMSATLNEKNIEVKEINKSALHTPKTDSDTKLKTKENMNYLSKGQDSCAKNVLTLDIFSDSDSNVIPPNSAQSTTVPNGVNKFSDINTINVLEIENSDRSISLKEVGVGSGINKKNKVKDNALIKKSSVRDTKGESSIFLNKNKLPICRSSLKKKVPHTQKQNIKNGNNSIQFSKKVISVNKFTDNVTSKLLRNPLKNKNMVNAMKKTDSKIKMSKSSIIENNDKLDERRDEENRTVWDARYRLKKSEMLFKDLNYNIYLQNKILRNHKNVNLNQRYKVYNSINNTLRPMKFKTEPTDKGHEDQLLPNIVCSKPNIESKRSFVDNKELNLRLLKIGVPTSNQQPQNLNNYYSDLNEKPRNKFRLMKDINVTKFNKRGTIIDLKSDIKHWKKNRDLKQIALESTNNLHQSIMKRRKMRQTEKKKKNHPTKKSHYKSSTISLPISLKTYFGKYIKATMADVNNGVKHKSVFPFMPDPIEILNLKYKKNYQNTYNDILKKHEILNRQETLNRNLGFLDYDLKKEFQTKSISNINAVRNLNVNGSKKLEEKLFKVLMKNAKKISLENKKPWVRYMHQMNDESNEKLSKVTEIQTYPSGCLKKPEFIIELLPVEENPDIKTQTSCDSQKDEGILQSIQIEKSNGSPNDTESLNTIVSSNNPKERCKSIINNTFHQQKEKAECSVLVEPSDNLKFNKIGNECEYSKSDALISENDIEKLISFSDLVKLKSASINDRKHVNHQSSYGSYNSPLNQENYIVSKHLEDIEEKVKSNKLNKNMIKLHASKPFKENHINEFETEKNVNEKINVINNDHERFKSTKNYNSSNETATLKSDHIPANKMKVEICSNVVCEDPIPNNSNSLLLAKENATDIPNQQHPKLTDSPTCTQEPIPLKMNFLGENQPEFLTSNPSKQIEPKFSSQNLHAIKISYNCSQPQSSVSEEPIKVQETKTELLTETSSTTESKNNNCYNQNLKSRKNSNVYENQIENNPSCSYKKRHSRDINPQHSNSFQNVSNSLNHLGNVNIEILTEDLNMPKDNCKKLLVKELDAPLLFISDENKNKMKKENSCIQQTQNTEMVLPTPQKNLRLSDIKNFQNLSLPFLQSKSLKFENLMNELKLSNNLKNIYPDTSSLKTNNKKVLENIKDFFRNSYNYFKPDNIVAKGIMEKSSPCSANAEVYHKNSQSLSNSFKEMNLRSEQQASSRSDKQSNIFPESSKPDFHQKWINHFIEENQIKLLPSNEPKLRKKASNFNNANEENATSFSNQLHASPKPYFSLSKKFKKVFSNDEFSVNDSKTEIKKKKSFNIHKKTKSDNIHCKNNGHGRFLNKITDKVFETLPVNRTKQKRSFCNFNHKNSYAKLNNKSRSLNQKMQTSIFKLDVINSKSKHEGCYFSNSDVPVEIPNFVKRKKPRRNEILPFRTTNIIPMKDIAKNKKSHSFKLNSDLELRAGEKFKLLKRLETLHNVNENPNPESDWLNSFSKNISTDDKHPHNSFITYIKRRKLLSRPYFKSNYL